MNNLSQTLMINLTLGVWASASGLNFIEHNRKRRQRSKRSTSDLNIAFRRRNHECGHARAFDGPGGELAHGMKLFSFEYFKQFFSNFHQRKFQLFFQLLVRPTLIWMKNGARKIEEDLII